MRVPPEDKGAFAPSPRWRREWGQGLAEFALILPILLLIIFLVIEAALVIQGYLAVEHAAREAVRWAITYQPVQGYRLDGAPCTDTDFHGPFLLNDPGFRCNPLETTEEYNARRVALIKETALQRAAGLRIDDDALGLTEATFSAHFNDPGFFGVRVWGFPSFQESEQLDHPGLPGLPVRVQVVHNVIILDPLFRIIAPHVRVEAHAEMINEGIQVGFGNVPPPTFNPTGVYVVTPQSPAATDTGTPTTPTPTPVPIHYNVDITFDHVINQMPDERGHAVSVRVTDDGGHPVADLPVSFSTDKGAYGYSGVSPTYAEDLTDGAGVAVRTVYANRPGVANLEAWIDLDGDERRDIGEPYDMATKEWTVSGPYVLASNHEVRSLDWITVDIYDHSPADNPHMLLWCRTSITGGLASAVLIGAVNVNAETGDAVDLPVEIPEGSGGYYRLETHTGLGSCGNAATLVAYSAEVRAIVAKPDVAVVLFNVPTDVQPTTVFTMSVVIANLSPGRIEEPFDVDFYLDPQSAPTAGIMGEMKQWVSSLGPYETVVVTTTMWVDSVGPHEIWAQVDTTDYIEEEDEGNNVGMISLSAYCPLEEHNGQVVIPASQFDDYQDGYYYSRTKVWQASSYGGTSTMLGLQDTGDGFYNYYDFDDPPSDGRDPPVLIYNVNFEHPGTYYIWMRGRPCAESARGCTQGASSNDSVWVTLDGKPTTNNYYRLTGWAAGGLSWASRIQGYTGQPRLVVPSAGVHQVQVRMREDGFEWATIVLTTTAGGPGPTGEGPVLACGAGEPPPWYDPTKPPGLLECTQLLQVGGFEGNPQTVFQYWRAGGTGAYQRTGYLQYEGAFSMRLHASLGTYPCQQNSYAPYLYQTVQIPTEVVSLTTIIVEGQRAVAGSLAPCSYPNRPDVDDVLYIQMRDGGGNPLSTATTIVNGGVVSETWGAFSVDFSGEVDLESLAGQNVQVYFYATHDQDFDGTFFYLDDLECNVCTQQPIPDPVPGTASIGGMTRALIGGVPQRLTGVDVWAYSQGGQVYHTRSIHDGTYHFYNIPPGTYTIYAEALIGGYLRIDVATVTVVADERNYGVDLLLQ